MSGPAIIPASTSPPGRAAILLHLLHRLIQYGQDLAAALRQHGAAALRTHHSSFATSDIALILARITRGLNLAAAFRLRLAAYADAPGTPRRPAQRTTGPRTPRPANPPAEEPDPRPGARLPTPEELAATLRRRPIGTVLADICRDLGITQAHPLWRELQRAIMDHRGNLTRLTLEIINRGAAAFGEAWAAMLAAMPPRAPATGPP